MVFAAPIVWVVFDSRSLVDADLVLVDDPSQRGSAVDDVLVRLGWDVFDGDMGVVLELGEIALADRAQLLDFVEFGRLIGGGGVGVDADLCRGVEWARFVMAMEIAELAASVCERREIFVTLDKRNARQRLFEIVLILFAIRRAMQYSIDVIEYVFFCDIATPILLARSGENPIRNARRAIA